MPRELRALHQRRGLSCAGSSADPAHSLSARMSAPAQTLASVATQGRCGGEEEQAAAVGVVARKACLKRLGAVSSGGGSGATKKVSFVSEPQVRVMSPPAAVEAMGRRRGRGALPSAQVGGGGSLRPTRARFGGGYSVLAGAAAPGRRSMRNAVNLGVEVEQVTVAMCNSAKFEEEVYVGETVDRKRKRNSRENSEHMDMVVGAQIGVSRRSTRSSGLLPEAPSVPPPVAEKKRARSKGPDVKEQTLEEQPAKVQDSGSTLNSALVTISDASRMVAESKLRSRAVQGKNSVEEENHFVKKLENRRQPTKTATRSNSYQELASSVEEEYQEQVVALCKAPPLRRSSRNHSKASGLLLNNNTSSKSNNWTRAREEGNEVKTACLSTHSAANDDIEEGIAKEDEHLELSCDGGTKDCAGTDEQIVQTVVRKGCLKCSGADVSSGSSSVAKKVTFNLMEQTAAEVAGFGSRARVVAYGEGNPGDAGSDAPLRWSRRNVLNFGASDGVEKIAGPVSQNISAKAHEKEEDAGKAVDRKRKANENVEDIGYVWLLPNIAKTNFSQVMAATKSVANKMATKVVANFGKKLSLYHVDHGANKVGQAAVVAMDQIGA